MTAFTDLLQQGAAHAWLFIPSAILLGALHGLEPGHSKTMMAAFIIAIRGTLTQAVLLGLAATASHTAVVWLIALGGLYFGQQWGGEASEPYFQLASAVAIITIAAWMAWRTWREQSDAHHHHEDKTRLLSTAEGELALDIFEDGVPPRWRISSPGGRMLPDAERVFLETLRPGGGRQVFPFVHRGEFLESTHDIPEPHAFSVELRMRLADGGEEVHALVFEEHDHAHMNLGDEDDAHARAHAADIRNRFAGRPVTTWQIIVFGLTGGLIPCPAAITVLLICMQLKVFSLGFVLVLCFSIGLALTLVSAGVLAALSVRHVSQRWSGFSAFARRAPYASAALILMVGLYTGWLGWHGLSREHAPSAGISAGAVQGDFLPAPTSYGEARRLG
ncbi:MULTISPECIES: nickel/cobalt efflux transporter [Xanthobacteraceae]|jgi:nickel/cobalt exporter|uniref:Nickel/cobalt efflux system n=1 Tax=Xanthobacter flavus TaxID=281 RepID=A0A9W6CMY9_XANFL|nr:MULTISPECIES: nickel/cobalt efflux transporter [Xanthobacter]MBP2147539.1 nickel/cobalt exporter [Xanthobacter flavus]MCG5238142.1 nickel/cobalt efflux transporter [Xanthobacter oligotrophicus]MDR6336857.1 nickel/cobalt exporter [Xanthobacter flavus]GLI25541.1 nickel/cobalt efflux system [Xanthobacter flavus]